MKTIFLPGVGCVCHGHSCGILKPDCFTISHLRVLRQMYYLVWGELVDLHGLSGDELKYVNELMLALTHAEKFVKG